jgi:hypothetical protein
MEEMKNDVCRTMSEWTESLEQKAEKDTVKDEKPQGEEMKTKEQIKAFPLLYNRDRGLMICYECVEVEDVDSKEVKVKSGLFVYEDDQLEGQRNLTPAFRNLKKRVTSHLLSSNHKISEKCREEKEKEDPTTDTEREIGMRIARIC